MFSVSRVSYADCDSFAIVAMSHGGLDENGKEYIDTKDDKIYTDTLWKKFTGDKCKTLAGKPKLFFIQVLQKIVIECNVLQCAPKKAANFKSPMFSLAEICHL